MTSPDLSSIRKVLGAYRSTAAHITKDDITAAWAEHEHVRERQRAGDTVVAIAPGDEWPIAISDGLTLACSDCGENPRFDYNVADDFWRQHVPEKPAHLGVVCLPCLDRRCGGVGLAGALNFIQWTGTGHTVELHPARRYEYEADKR